MIFPWIAHGCLIKAPFVQLPTILHLRRGRISRCSPQVLRRQGKLWTLMRHVAENLPEVSQVGNVQKKHRKHHVFDLPKVWHVRETPWILDVHILVGLGGKFCWKAWSLPRRLGFPGDFLGISPEPTPGTCYDGTFGDWRHRFLWEDCLDCNLRMVFVTALPNGLEVLLVVSGWTCYKLLG